MVIVLAAMNLRGIRESGTFFAIPTYAFMVAILGMCGYGLLRLASGDLPEVESADLEIARPGLRGLADDVRADVPAGPGVLVGLCRAHRRRGDLQRRARVPQAQEQERGHHAAAAGLIAIAMMMSVIVLANRWGSSTSTRMTSTGSRATGEPVPAGYDQHTVIAQIARAVFSDFSPGFYLVVTVTGVILVLAANTAFNGFPVLGSILAQDGFAPRALGSRGDRLAYSNGIVFLAVMAIILIQVFDAETTRLIQLYIVGVFVSFNLSQLGMIRHWTRHLKTERDPRSGGGWSGRG